MIHIAAIDVGGTKIAGGLFSEDGKLLQENTASVSGLAGREVGRTICEMIREFEESTFKSSGSRLKAIGICVPGIYNPEKGTVWAPNLPGWESYPLLDEIRNSLDSEIPVIIDSDRSCYILGEVWRGAARGCRNAIYLAVGTGIGAGILANGTVIQGTGYSAGAVGWMALNRPYFAGYQQFGCFEYHASGDGLARVYRNYLAEMPAYRGELDGIPPNKLTAKDIFEAAKKNDTIAKKVIAEAVEYWGMSVANLVSIFNPEKVILGGGVFESAAPLVGQIITEAKKWAQPIAIEQASIELSALGKFAGLYGAARLALASIKRIDTYE
ncbi:MAG: ROK family protein [Balneolaceae bacterium]|nr:MAG: ROK family protein [Balneolaceae bacterium]